MDFSVSVKTGLLQLNVESSNFTATYRPFVIQQAFITRSCWTRELQVMNVLTFNTFFLSKYTEPEPLHSGKYYNRLWNLDSVSEINTHLLTYFKHVFGK